MCPRSIPSLSCDNRLGISHRPSSKSGRINWPFYTVFQKDLQNMFHVQSINFVSWAWAFFSTKRRNFLSLLSVTCSTASHSPIVHISLLSSTRFQFKLHTRPYFQSESNMRPCYEHSVSGCMFSLQRTCIFASKYKCSYQICMPSNSPNSETIDSRKYGKGLRKKSNNPTNKK